MPWEDRGMNSTDPYWLHTCPHNDGRAFCKKCDRCKEVCCDCWIEGWGRHRADQELEEERNGI